MKKGNFGETLRREREMRGVSLEEISDATRISTRFLLALENEQWSHLPGGVFNRGFVRSVARFLGIDEDALVAEYALVTNDQPQVAVWAIGAKARTRVRPWVAALVLLALAAGSYFGWREASPWLAPRLSELWAQVTSGRSPNGVAAADRSPAPVAPQASPSPSPAESAELRLKLEAGGSTVLTVVADGVTRFSGRMARDDKKEFTAREKFDLTVSDPSALFVTLNGQEMPPLGRPGERGSITLTRADLKPPQEGSH